MNKISQILLLVVSIIAGSCDVNNTGDIIISTHGSTESHSEGKDCMECHNSGGDAGLWFSIAGTVYDTNLNKPYPNTIVNIFSDIDINDIPTEVLEVDGKGNFYSNVPIDWQNGLFVSVSSNNEIKNMNGINFTGSCNSCHGVTVPYINVE